MVVEVFITQLPKISHNKLKVVIKKAHVSIFLVAKLLYKLEMLLNFYHNIEFEKKKANGLKKNAKLKKFFMPVVDEKIKVLDGGDPQIMFYSWLYPTVPSKNSIIYEYNFL